jgi:hypothetical protein
VVARGWGGGAFSQRAGSRETEEYRRIQSTYIPQAYTPIIYFL